MSKNESSCMTDFDPDSLTIEQARSLVLELTPVISETETVTLANASGRILATDCISSVKVPPARNSAMDGYAIRFSELSADANTTLQLAGKSLAGHPFESAVEKGTAIRITTGALVPENADCIIMQEHVSVDEGNLEIPIANHKHGQFIRDAGTDIGQGETVLTAGTYLGAAELGLIAAIGQSEVTVFRRPIAAIFSTGDELVAPGESPKNGQIYDSNRFTLTSLFTQADVDVIDLGIVQDSPTALRETFDKASTCDLIVSTGGVSVGEADYVRQILEEKGSLHMWKVAMKPGRPLTVGRLSDRSVFFGLPGNPVSGMVTYYLFVTSALRKMRSQPIKKEFSIKACCQNKLKKMPGRVEYQRGILSKNDEQVWIVETTGLQDSHVLTSMHKANCFIVLNMASSGAEANEFVDVIPFESLE